MQQAVSLPLSDVALLSLFWGRQGSPRAQIARKAAILEANMEIEKGGECGDADALLGLSLLN